MMTNVGHQVEILAAEHLRRWAFDYVHELYANHSLAVKTRKSRQIRCVIS